MVRLELLGGFRVSIGTMVVPHQMWRRRKDAALIKLLCLAPRHRLRREQLMEYLWPDLAPVAAAANLRKSVHFVRHMYEGRYVTEPVIADGDPGGPCTRIGRWSDCRTRPRSSRHVPSRPWR